MPARRPARSVKSKPVRAQFAAERTQHAPARTRLARQLAAGDGDLVAAVEVGQRGVDFRQQADRQDHVGDRARRAAGEVAERHDLRAARAPSARSPVGEIEARLDAVEDVGRARLGQHRLRVARRPAARRVAPGRRALAPCGMRHSAAPVALRRTAAAALRIAAACAPFSATRADDDHGTRRRPSATSVKFGVGQRIAAICDGATIVLAGDVEGEVEIDRIDHVHLGAARPGLAHALVQQRQLVAQVGSRR